MLDTGAVSRGSGSKQTSRERDIRKSFVENDLIEGVILLPENLFYNTSPHRGFILLLNRRKPIEREGTNPAALTFLKYFVSQKPKNVLTDEGNNDAASEVYQSVGIPREVERRSSRWRMPEKTDYNLSPSAVCGRGRQR